MHQNVFFLFSSILIFSWQFNSQRITSFCTFTCKYFWLNVKLLRIFKEGNISIVQFKSNCSFLLHIGVFGILIPNQPFEIRKHFLLGHVCISEDVMVYYGHQIFALFSKVYTWGCLSYAGIWFLLSSPSWFWGSQSIKATWNVALIAVANLFTSSRFFHSAII